MTDDNEVEDQELSSADALAAAEDQVDNDEDLDDEDDDLLDDIFDDDDEDEDEDIHDVFTPPDPIEEAQEKE